MKLVSYFCILRSRQWLKNMMLFFPPFLAGQILQPGLIIKGVLPFVSFCFVSSAGYIFNDLLDRETDAHHPKKCLRPISSGDISLSGAGFLAVFLFLIGVLLASITSPLFLLLLASYGAITVVYSLKLKALPVVDIFCISAGFLIRLQAGGELFHIPISPWLFLSVFLLAVFLSTGKRLGEQHVLGSKSANYRSSLAHYPSGFLDGTMYMTGSAVLVTYAMYSLNRPPLIYSVPLCLFGLLRFMMRVCSGKGGDPTESLLRDRLLFAVGVLWVLTVFWSIYS